MSQTQEVSMFKLALFVLACFISEVYCMETCTDKWNSLNVRGVPIKYKDLEGYCGSEFRDKLSLLISTNKDLGYNSARKIMFSDLDNSGGEVCDVYTNFCMSTQGIPDPSIMNCEHTWPQSMGATGIAKSDLNHLYPVGSRVNSTRSNYPFCEVLNKTWESDGSSLGTSKFGTKCFEPKDSHKGSVARALMYFSVRYNKSLDKDQEYFARKWNLEFPPTEEDTLRNDKIQEIQNNRNPFIDVSYFSNFIDAF